MNAGTVPGKGFGEGLGGLGGVGLGGLGGAGLGGLGGGGLGGLGGVGLGGLGGGGLGVGGVGLGGGGLGDALLAQVSNSVCFWHSVRTILLLRQHVPEHCSPAWQSSFSRMTVTPVHDSVSSHLAIQALTLMLPIG